jgi:hypothetical protein
VPSQWKLLHPTGALAEMMAADAEREGQPFGGYQGERAGPPEPLAPAPAPLIIPPAPWSEGGEPDSPEEAEP